MTTFTSFQKANYIVKMVKSVNKNLEYALDIIVWYSDNDKQDIEIQNEIKKLWNN